MDCSLNPTGKESTIEDLQRMNHTLITQIMCEQDKNRELTRKLAEEKSKSDKAISLIAEISTDCHQMIEGQYLYLKIVKYFESIKEA